MDRTYKQVIGVVLGVLIVGLAIYGTWLPMRKGEIFITTLQGLQTAPASSLSDLESKISTPLDYPSPSGQEELVRNVANSVLAFVEQGSDASSTAELLSYLNSYYGPILARGKGMSFGQDLYLEGVINELAYASTGNPAFLAQAEQWYKEGAALGPNRPQVLYGLFDVYRSANDTTDEIATGQKILMNWPTDTRVQQTLSQLKVPSTTKPATGK